MNQRKDPKPKDVPNYYEPVYRGDKLWGYLIKGHKRIDYPDGRVKVE